MVKGVVHLTSLSLAQNFDIRYSILNIRYSQKISNIEYRISNFEGDAPRLHQRSRPPICSPSRKTKTVHEDARRLIDCRHHIHHKRTTHHPLCSATAVSIPVKKIVPRLRAPSSCTDSFVKSQDEDGARRRETIDRYSSFDPSQENHASSYLLGRRRFHPGEKNRAPSSCTLFVLRSVRQVARRRRCTKTRDGRLLSPYPSPENHASSYLLGPRVSVPVKKIVPRLRAPSSCSDPFARSLARLSLFAALTGENISKLVAEGHRSSPQALSDWSRVISGGG